MTTQSALDTVTRTAGIEIYAGTTHWFTSCNSGVVTYNVALSSAGTRYIVANVNGLNIGETITWS